MTPGDGICPWRFRPPGPEVPASKESGRRPVLRVRPGSDRRQVHVRITEAGQRFSRKVPMPLQEVFIQQIHEMHPHELDSLLNAVDKLAAMLQSASAAERPGKSKR